MQVSDRLRWAVENNNLHMVKRILSRYPDLLENRDLKGWTSLHYAGYHGHYAICVYLIQKGHDSEEISLTHERNTPLHLAASKNREQAVHYLAQHMSRCLDWKNNKHETALMVAAKLGNDPCINLLLDFGADIDTFDRLGNRPIHVAAAYGHLKTLRTLIDRNADTSCQNFEGWRPVQYCSTYQVQDYLQSLIHEKNESTKKQQAFFKPKKASTASTSTTLTSSSSSTNAYNGSSNGSAATSAPHRKPNIYLPPITHVQPLNVMSAGSEASFTGSDSPSPTPSRSSTPRTTPQKLSLSMPNSSPTVSSPLSSPATTSVTTPVKQQPSMLLPNNTPTPPGQNSNNGSPQRTKARGTITSIRADDPNDADNLLIPPRKTSLVAHGKLANGNGSSSSLTSNNGYGNSNTNDFIPESPPPSILPPTPRKSGLQSPQLSPSPSSTSIYHSAISMPTFGHTFRSSDSSIGSMGSTSQDGQDRTRSSSRSRLMDITVKPSSHIR